LYALGKLVQDASQENPTFGISGQGDMDEFSVLNNMRTNEGKSSSDEDKENLLSRENNIDEGLYSYSYMTNIKRIVRLNLVKCCLVAISLLLTLCCSYSSHVRYVCPNPWYRQSVSKSI